MKKKIIIIIGIVVIIAASIFGVYQCTGAFTWDYRRMQDNAYWRADRNTDRR